MTHSAEDIARAIANGHSFEKHVLERREFSSFRKRYGENLGIETRDGLERHIVSVLNDSMTKGFASQRGDLFFYHEKSNTLVVYEKDRIDLGSVYRPTRSDYFDRLWREDAAKRFEWNFENSVERGGYPALVQKLRDQNAPAPRKNPFEKARERALGAAPKDREKTERGRDR